MSREELILKYWSFYLPYRAQLKLTNKVVWRPNIDERPIGRNSDVTLTPNLFADIITGTFDSLSQFQLMLYPLSRLNKELEIDVEKFTPIHKLGIYDPRNVDYLIEQIRAGLVEYIVMIRLISWHFDVFDLCSKNLAIDKNE